MSFTCQAKKGDLVMREAFWWWPEVREMAKKGVSALLEAEEAEVIVCKILGALGVGFVEFVSFP